MNIDEECNSRSAIEVVIAIVDAAIADPHRAMPAEGESLAPKQMYVGMASLAGFLVEETLETLRRGKNFDWRNDRRLALVVDAAILPRVTPDYRVRTKRMVKILLALTDGWRTGKFRFDENDVDFRLLSNLAGILAKDSLDSGLWDPKRVLSDFRFEQGRRAK